MLSALLLLAVVQPGDALAAGFAHPPASARPHTWWHWMDGNVSKEGLTADLEAMAEVGIGGAQMFTVGQGIPKGPVGYNSPKWHELTAHAIREADRLGIELCLHNCAGWSSSGGPWITPEHAMQVVAWSSINVKGPRQFKEKLARPKAPRIVSEVDFYREIACYAIPTPASMGKPDLARTGVVRANDLDPDLSGMSPAIDSGQIVLLTSHLAADGTLTWDVPAGDWTILRMGHVPTGKNNHPAPAEGEGLEVDKLSREALDAHWKGLMAKVIEDAGPLAGKSLNNALIDSYEVGSQNWTPKFREEFMKRRGYDILPYLPVLAGVTVDSKERSERFLWDMRRTIADLFTENYFGYFGELCRKNGLKFSTEPYGDGNFDNIQAGGTADIPMGEFWIAGGPDTMQTTKLASSVGHVYNHQVVGAESFTATDYSGRWMEEPYTAKALGDLAFTKGINRYIFHRYAHQPWLNVKPGMTMGPWGTHLERTQTWWTEAGEWMKYVARCQYLLQRGKFVADALYFYGEGAPADMPYPNPKPFLPKGYDYDYCDTTVVMKRLSVKDGRLVLPDGMTYRVLVLPDSKFMTPALVNRVSELVRAGATVIGPKPEHTPSLSNFRHAEAEVQRVAGNIWGGIDGKTVKQRTYGKGRVIWGMTMQEVFDQMKVRPDFEYKSLTGGSKLVTIHRRIDGAEVYFVSNQQYDATEAEMTFRVDGRTPELWHADTGKMETAPVFRREGDRMVVPLRLNPAESVFVVFRKPLSNSYATQFGRDGEKRTLAKAPVIAVQSARYETADGVGTDVTAIVQQLVREGQTEIPATNTMFGDPAYMVVKQLTITFTVDGKSVKKTVPENQMLALTSMPKTAVPMASYALGYEGSRLMLTPWKKGSYSAVMSNGRRRTVTVKEDPRMMNLDGSWKVIFEEGWGAPESIALPRLMSWTEHQNKGVKYFSGTGTYVRDIDVPSAMLGSGRAVVLDLGRVKNFATVSVNGDKGTILWKEPFVIDVSKRLRPGHNKLTIAVTNLWPNRIIGDEQLPPDVEWNGAQLKEWPKWFLEGKPSPTGRYTFSTWRFYTKDSPLLESGLLGPVVIRSARKVAVN